MLFRIARPVILVRLVPTLLSLIDLLFELKVFTHWKFLCGCCRGAIRLGTVSAVIDSGNKHTTNKVHLQAYSAKVRPAKTLHIQTSLSSSSSSAIDDGFATVNSPHRSNCSWRPGQWCSNKRARVLPLETLCTAFTWCQAC